MQPVLMFNLRFANKSSLLHVIVAICVRSPEAAVADVLLLGDGEPTILHVKEPRYCREDPTMRDHEYRGIGIGFVNTRDKIADLARVSEIEIIERLVNNKESCVFSDGNSRDY